MKKCSKCFVEKDFTMFDKHKGCIGGVNSVCKECKSKHHKEYYLKPGVKERSIQRRKIHYASNRNEEIKKSKLYRNQPEIKEKIREWHKQHNKKPEIRARNLELAKINRTKQEVKDRIKNNRLIREYGITLVQYKQMLAGQNNSCAICKKDQSEFKNSLAVDHNHKTGKVRALLCYHCNKMKVSKHTIETAKMVLDYLLKYDDPV